jgi:hypothetical protein
MLRRQGIVDRFALAHNVPLAPRREPAPAVDDLRWLRLDWEALEGITPTEEPAPQIGIPVRYNWCTGPVARVQMTCFHPGRYLLVIDCQNRLFDQQNVDLAVNGVTVKQFSLDRSGDPPDQLMRAEVDLLAGPVEASLSFGRWLEPSPEQPLQLALLLHDCRLIRL